MTPQTALESQATLERIVRRYVESTLHWPETDYELHIHRQQEDNSSIAVVDVIHRSDLQPTGRADSRSIQVHVNLTSQKVVKELAYQ